MWLVVKAESQPRNQIRWKYGGPIPLTMIQMAWRWLKLQPESAITKWFHAYVARDAGGGRDRRARKRAIVGVARKLLIALWRYATQGLVPEGAIVS